MQNRKSKVENSTSVSPLKNGFLAEAKFRPILFSTDMVTAILEGRKTMTRRKIKNKDQPYLINEKSFINYSDSFGWNVKHKIEDNPLRFEITQQFKCPYGKIGDVLWIREKWRHNETQTGFPYHHYQDGEIYTDRDNEKWKPSIFMPKAACRIFLKITNIRVERLQDISEEDAKSEGVYVAECCHAYYHGFALLWQKINGKESWEANPFVWVIEFELTGRPLGFFALT